MKIKVKSRKIGRRMVFTARPAGTQDAKIAKRVSVGFVLILKERFKIRTHQALTGDWGIKGKQ